MPLTKPNEWLITHTSEEGTKEQYKLLFEFKRNRVDVTGGGTLENGDTITAKMQLRPDNPSNWRGHYDTEEGLVELLIE